MADDKLRMDAYYYSFDPTGDEMVDRVLSAVACAGKAYHHTEDWCEDIAIPYEPVHRGQNAVEWIQNAANDAAAALTAARREADELRALFEKHIPKVGELAEYLGFDAEEERPTAEQLIQRASDFRQQWDDTLREKAQAEADRDELRARVAVLAALVERCLSLMGHVGFEDEIGEIEAALTTTDRAAGERWRAMEQFIETMRELSRRGRASAHGIWFDLSEALDQLGRAGGEHR